MVRRNFTKTELLRVEGQTKMNGGRNEGIAELRTKPKELATSTEGLSSVMVLVTSQPMD